MENLLFSPSAAGHYLLRISQLISGLYLTRLDFFLQRSWAMYIVPFYLYYIFAYYYDCACIYMYIYYRVVPFLVIVVGMFRFTWTMTTLAGMDRYDDKCAKDHPRWDNRLGAVPIIPYDRRRPNELVNSGPAPLFSLFLSSRTHSMMYTIRVQIMNENEFSYSGRCLYWKVNCCLLHKKLHIVSYIGSCEPFCRIVFRFACPVAPFSLMIVILFSCRFPRLSHSHPSRKWQQRAKKKKDEGI